MTHKQYAEQKVEKEKKPGDGVEQGVAQRRQAD